MASKAKTVVKNDEANEVVAAIEELSREKHINKEVLFTKIESALVSAYKKEFRKADNVRASIDRVTGRIEVLARKTIVEEVTDPTVEITLTEVRAKYPELANYELGDLVEVPTMPAQFGRIAAQTAKQVIVQNIHEAERSGIRDEFSEKENEILTGIVQRIENDKVYMELGRAEGILEENQMMLGETVRVGDRLKVYVLEVGRNKSADIMVSRIHTGLVKRLFELEVPEIRSGDVIIKNITREAGSRTKMAVFSNKKDIDPIGSCVGPKGMRVEKVVNELKGEKIDIVKWSAEPKEFIEAALSPAKVEAVLPNEEEKMARVIVPDNQLSLAIGKEGQNARLAARLTGWKIDIKSRSQVEEEALHQPEVSEETSEQDA